MISYCWVSFKPNEKKIKNFAPAWVRTTDLQVNSLALYLLSYKSLMQTHAKSFWSNFNFLDFEEKIIFRLMNKNFNKS
jgi:hypothetical protein